MDEAFLDLESVAVELDEEFSTRLMTRRSPTIATTGTLRSATCLTMAETASAEDADESI